MVDRMQLIGEIKADIDELKTHFNATAENFEMIAVEMRAFRFLDE